ncbi:phosphatase PAP2 family protein [Kribbella sp. NPDC051718]|uniref:phosphatase PAP2 family protein n=1 Tax=Kribbella sp. NPDC051718 TaxID=3155168 RepID=UPI00341D8273
MKSLIALVALYVVAICTPWGQRAENSLLVGYADPALIYRIVYSVGPPPLKLEELTIVAGLTLILVVALLRRQWILAVAGIGVPVATIACTELLHTVILPRPDIVNAPISEIEPSFPSGHVAIVAGLVLGAILVATPRARPYVAAVGTVWLALIGAAVVALLWHRPSDAIGATLIACFWYGIATRLLTKQQQPTATPRTLIVLGLAAIGAICGGARTDSYPRSFVFIATGLLCATIVWFTVARTSPAAAARSRLSSGTPEPHATADRVAPRRPPQ